MRERELTVVCRAQGTHPGVKQLHRIDTRVDLRDQIVPDERRQLVAEEMPGVGVPVHQGLGAGKVVGMATFDCVRGERERRACESDQGNTAGQFALNLVYRLKNMGKGFTRLDHLEAFDVGARIDGAFPVGALHP